MAGTTTSRPPGSRDRPAAGGSAGDSKDTSDCTTTGGSAVCTTGEVRGVCVSGAAAKHETQGGTSDACSAAGDDTDGVGLLPALEPDATTPWYGEQALLLPKALYFVVCAANAAFFPFIVPFYYSLGLSADQIGVLSAARPLMLMVFSPMWGYLSDKVFGPRAILVLSICAVTVLRTAFALAPSLPNPFTFLVALCYVSEVFACAVFPLLDVMVLSLLGPDRRLEWGKTRLWGAVGWGIFALVFGALLDVEGLSTMWVLYPITMAITLCIVTRMPRYQRVEATTPAPDGDGDDDNAGDGDNADVEAGGTVEVGQEGCRGAVHRLHRLLSRREVVLFLGIVMCMGCLMGIISNFLFLRLEQLSAPDWLLGASLTVTCLAEVPLLHYSGALIKRFGVVSVLAASLVAYGLRLQWYAHMTNPYMVLFAEGLHGVTYGAGWAAGTCYASIIAPAGLEATMQGLVSAAHWGVGSALGALTGGRMYAVLGAVDTFNAAGVVAVVGLILCVIAWRDSSQRAPADGATRVPTSDDAVDKPARATQLGVSMRSGELASDSDEDSAESNDGRSEERPVVAGGGDVGSVELVPLTQRQQVV